MVALSASSGLCGKFPKAERAGCSAETARDFQIRNRLCCHRYECRRYGQSNGLGKDIQPSQVQTATLPGHAEFIHGGSYWIPDPEARSVVFSRMLNEKISVAEREEKTQTYGSDAATAATTYSDETDRPVKITIKYPKGQEQEARQLETALNGLGYKVRYIMRGDTSDCQHEQIVQMSYRADNALTERLKENFRRSHHGRST